MAMRKEEIITWLNTLEGDPLIAIDDGGLAIREATQTTKYNYLEIGGMPDYFCQSCQDYVEGEIQRDGRVTCFDCGRLIMVEEEP